jgi:hypothetical protein
MIKAATSRNLEGIKAKCFSKPKIKHKTAAKPKPLKTKLTDNAFMLYHRTNISHLQKSSQVM